VAVANDPPLDFKESPIFPRLDLIGNYNLLFKVVKRGKNVKN